MRCAAHRGRGRELDRRGVGSATHSYGAFSTRCMDRSDWSVKDCRAPPAFREEGGSTVPPAPGAVGSPRSPQLKARLFSGSATSTASITQRQLTAWLCHATPGLVCDLWGERRASRQSRVVGRVRLRWPAGRVSGATRVSFANRAPENGKRPDRCRPGRLRDDCSSAPLVQFRPSVSPKGAGPKSLSPNRGRYQPVASMNEG